METKLITHIEKPSNLRYSTQTSYFLGWSFWTIPKLHELCVCVSSTNRNIKVTTHQQTIFNRRWLTSSSVTKATIPLFSAKQWPVSVDVASDMGEACSEAVRLAPSNGRCCWCSRQFMSHAIYVYLQCPKPKSKTHTHIYIIIYIQYINVYQTTWT